MSAAAIRLRCGFLPSCASFRYAAGQRGQWLELESGLNQNWMRDYDPTTGRYIQADLPGLVDGASVCRYALQNPGRYVDPRGEFVINPFTVGLARAAFSWAVRRYGAQVATAAATAVVATASAPDWIRNVPPEFWRYS